MGFSEIFDIELYLQKKISQINSTEDLYEFTKNIILSDDAFSEISSLISLAYATYDKDPSIQTHYSKRREEYIHLTRCSQCERIIYVGDIHGDFASILDIFNKYGFPNKNTYYVFLGDYFERGPKQLETIIELLAIKIKYPEYITIQRGNHELDRRQWSWRPDGFGKELISQFPNANERKILKSLFYQLFNRFSSAFISPYGTFATHGFLTDQVYTEINTDKDLLETIDLEDLLWSEPFLADSSNPEYFQLDIMDVLYLQLPKSIYYILDEPPIDLSLEESLEPFYLRLRGLFINLLSNPSFQFESAFKTLVSDYRKTLKKSWLEIHEDIGEDFDLFKKDWDNLETFFSINPIIIPTQMRNELRGIGSIVSPSHILKKLQGIGINRLISGHVHINSDLLIENDSPQCLTLTSTGSQSLYSHRDFKDRQERGQVIIETAAGVIREDIEPVFSQRQDYLLLYKENSKHIMFFPEGVEIETHTRKGHQSVALPFGTLILPKNKTNLTHKKTTPLKLVAMLQRISLNELCQVISHDEAIDLSIALITSLFPNSSTFRNKPFSRNQILDILIDWDEEKQHGAPFALRYLLNQTGFFNKRFLDLVTKDTEPDKYLSDTSTESESNGYDPIQAEETPPPIKTSSQESIILYEENLDHFIFFPKGISIDEGLKEKHRVIVRSFGSLLLPNLLNKPK